MTGSIAIVGGSLVGLALGIGLARTGLAIEVYDQSRREARGGTGLGLDPNLLSRATGVDTRSNGHVAPLRVLNEGYRETSTWLEIFRWLRATADVTGNLIVREGARVNRITALADGAEIIGEDFVARADLVIGADGYRSVVRQTVAPERPHANFGGFVIWRGLIDEASLPQRISSQRSFGAGSSRYPEAARLVIYRVPGPEGKTTPGQRSVNFGWYDATMTAWLRNKGVLENRTVTSSVAAESIDDDLRAKLTKTATERWPGSASAVITAAISHRSLFGTPLVQYVPEHLYKGRVALVGDAAHVASPMVGAGFSSGLLDCISLIDALHESGGPIGDAGLHAFARYERDRLEPNRARVLGVSERRRNCSRPLAHLNRNADTS